MSSKGKDTKKADNSTNTAAIAQIPINADEKTTILLNVEVAVKDLVSKIAKKEEIKGVEVDKYADIPNSLTGVVMHFLVNGLKNELNVEFEEPPVSLNAVRGATSFDKKVAGKKRLLTRQEKNDLLAKTEMKYWEKDINEGKITIDKVMIYMKDAFERKQNYEEMGYVLPPNKTEYPYRIDEENG